MADSGFLRFVPLMLAIICWSLPPIMLRWLNEAGMDVYTMNVYRMFAGGVFLTPFVLRLNFDGVKRAVRKPWKFIIPAVLFTLVMILWVMGLLRLGAAVASLVSRSTVIFMVVIGILFFADERAILLDKRFLIAVAVALLGVAGVVIFSDEVFAAGNYTLESGFWVGVVLTIGANLSWVIYIYTVKVMIRSTGPLVGVVMVTYEATFLMLLVAAVAHYYGAADLAKPFHLDFTTNLVLLGSGVVGAGMGGILFYKSVDLVGVAITQTSLLAMPVIVGFMAFVFLGERLTLPQLGAAAVLLGSLGYIIITKAKKMPPSPQPGRTGKMVRGPV